MSEMRETAPATTSPTTDAGAMAPAARSDTPQRRAARARPRGFVGPIVAVVGGVCSASGIALEAGLLFAFGAALLGLGLTEVGRAFEGWREARALRNHDVIVRRRLFRAFTLELPAIDGVASRFHRSFAIGNARAWRVTAPASCPFDAVVERRGLLSLGGVPLDDPAFDKAYVVKARDVDGAHLAALLPPAARAAVARVFAHRDVTRVRMHVDGDLHVELKGFGSDAFPIVELVPSVRALIDALGERTRQLPSVAALRAHSPTGNPIGLG